MLYVVFLFDRTLYVNQVVRFTAIHKTISAVLLLGNMQFKQERNSDQATLPDDTG